MSRKNERTLIIYAHPYEGSFNHAVLEAGRHPRPGQGRPTLRRSQLLADGFDPRYTTEELALFGEGGTLDPLVTRYQDLIDSATRLIIIAPIWWSELPGVLKGFVDKVMKHNWAYTATRTGIKGRLTHIREVLVLTTSIAPTWSLKRLAGNAVNGVFLGSVMKQLGMGGRRWVNYGKVDKGGASRARST